MGIAKSHHPPAPLHIPLLLVPVLVLVLAILPPAAVAADLYALVYKGCGNQSFPGSGAASLQTVAALSSSLTTQSATSKFYKTTASAAYPGGQSVFGLFQCRGDLSPTDCSACVARVVPMWSALCSSAVAARVQLAGCLALYEVSGFPQVSGTQLLYKTCGSGGGGGDFEVKRDTAFAQLQSGVAAGQGFYATSYSSVYAMAQCEGDLSTGDCGECVSEAVQRSEVECGGASSGQIYQDKCYISYSYYSGGAPHGGSSIFAGVSGGGINGGGQTAKTVAIVVGAAAGVGFLVICLLFARSVIKRQDD